MFSDILDFFDSDLGSYKLTTKSDSDGCNLTYDFETPDGMNSSISVNGSDFLEAAEKLIEETTKWCEKYEADDEDNNDVKLEDYSKEELINIIAEQSDIITDYEKDFDSMEQEIEELKDYSATLEEKIDNLHIDLKAKDIVLDKIKFAIG